LFYADFEADTTIKFGKKGEQEVHIPYICCLMNEDASITKSFKGENCVSQLVEFLPDKAIVYFHNLGYDFNFIAKHGVNEMTKKGNKIMNGKVKYEGKTLYFKDSFSHVSMALKQFPSAFKLGNVQKELFPYQLYSMERLAIGV
jgi:hypothetical protein